MLKSLPEDRSEVLTQVMFIFQLAPYPGRTLGPNMLGYRIITLVGHLYNPAVVQHHMLVYLQTYRRCKYRESLKKKPQHWQAGYLNGLFETRAITCRSPQSICSGGYTHDGCGLRLSSITACWNISWLLVSSTVAMQNCS